MWLNLEVGAARALNRHETGAVDVPGDQPWTGRNALAVVAAHTYLPEASLESLPEAARSEIAAGLSGPLRHRIAQARIDDPSLPSLRDELLVGLGATPDVTGALTLVDQIYAGRLLRRHVPPIVTASCLVWYGHWRTTNSGPSLTTAEELRRLVDQWLPHPTQRSHLDLQIITKAQRIAGDPLIALEDLAV